MFFQRDRGPARVYDFTDRVRRVLARAREESLRLRHGYVGTEHILLGLTREEEGVAAAVLANLGVSVGKVREEVERRVTPGTSGEILGEIPYRSGAKRVLERAMTEAREMGHAYVGTEHLLLALLRVEDSVAANALAALRVTHPQAREGTLRLLATDPRPAPGRSRLAVRIDDASSLPIYEQIVEQVREAVATRRVEPGDRLPTVRQLADSRDIAPGTVARAYAELERLGVVVTEGARGTRVAARKPEGAAEGGRPEMVAGLLRPVVVAAFHLGATAAEVRTALDAAMRGIYPSE